jgi:hypothetical protein
VLAAGDIPAPKGKPEESMLALAVGKGEAGRKVAVSRSHDVDEGIT